jgi:hypothetical protein
MERSKSLNEGGIVMAFANEGLLEANKRRDKMSEMRIPVLVNRQRRRGLILHRDEGEWLGWGGQELAMSSVKHELQCQ